MGAFWVPAHYCHGWGGGGQDGPLHSGDAGGCQIKYRLPTRSDVRSRSIVQGDILKDDSLFI